MSVILTLGRPTPESDMFQRRYLWSSDMDAKSSFSSSAIGMQGQMVAL